MSKFYSFNQNNSGGSFTFDKKKGISHFVIIEAESEEQAVSKAETIGLYWDGCDNGIDCHCCGDRWSKYWVQSSDTPKIYEQDVSEGIFKSSRQWMEKGFEGFIHYLNGTIKPIAVQKVKGY